MRRFEFDMRDGRKYDFSAPLEKKLDVSVYRCRRRERRGAKLLGTLGSDRLPA